MTFRIWQTVTDVYAYCWREIGAALRYGAIPFLAIAMLEALVPTDQNSPILGQIRSVGELIICVPLMVAWFRTVALGEAAATQPIFTFGRREGRFLFWQLAFFAGGVAAAAAGASVIYLIKVLLGDSVAGYLITTVLSVAGVLFFLAVLNRLSLILVLVATDQPVNIRTAWDMTRGIVWPLLWALILLSLPIGMVALLAAQMVELKTVTATAAGTADTSRVTGAMSIAASAFVTVAAAILTATFFALVYRKIMDARPAGLSSPESAPTVS